jgi:uncharacterized protein YvpB
MILRILTADQNLIHDLLDAPQGQTPDKHIPSNDFSITPAHDYHPSRGMVGVPEILEFAVEISTNIGVGLFTAWIYDLIKKHHAKAELSGKELPPSEKEIEIIIRQTIRKSNDTR